MGEPAPNEATPAPEDFERVLAGTAYRYVRTLGSGGMGTVVEAEHVALGSRVAVKVLHERMAARPELLDRFRIEAQTLARLQHPGLVRATDLGRTPSGHAFLVMEMLRGRTLRAELDARGALPPSEAVAVMRDVLGALAAAHAIGIVHRDVKPENVFLAEGESGRLVKLLDFGVAKVLAESAAVPGAPAAPSWRTRTGMLVGTPAYLSPEQIEGGAISAASDVYAAGLMLHQLLVGHHPFSGRAPGELLKAQLLEVPPRPSFVARQPVPPELDAIVLRAAAKAPADRYRDAKAFADALAPFAGALGAGLAASADVTSPLRPIRGTSAETAAATPRARTADVEIVPITRAAGADVSTPALGVIAALAGALDLCWRLYAGVQSLAHLIAPGDFVAQLAAAAPSVPVELLRSLAIRSATAELVRAVAIGAASAALVWLGARVWRRRAGAAAALVRWGPWALAAIALSLVIDLAAVLPLQLEYHAATPNEPVVRDTVMALTLALILAPALAQIAFVLALRAWAGRRARG